MEKIDFKFMKKAYEMAEKAYGIGEVPVGAVIVHRGEIIGTGMNRREASKNPIAHAEIEAIEEASKNLNSWRLLDCSLYVTLEPCAMCAGAIINSRIERVIIGARDYKRGCCGTVEDITKDSSLEKVVMSTLEDE